jgi:hypothetical protein
MSLAVQVFCRIAACPSGTISSFPACSNMTSGLCSAFARLSKAVRLSHVDIRNGDRYLYGRNFCGYSASSIARRSTKGVSSSRPRIRCMASLSVLARELVATAATPAPIDCPQITMGVLEDVYRARVQSIAARASSSIPLCEAEPLDFQYPRYESATKRTSGIWPSAPNTVCFKILESSGSRGGSEDALLKQVSDCSKDWITDTPLKVQHHQRRWINICRLGIDTFEYLELRSISSFQIMLLPPNRSTLTDIILHLLGPRERRYSWHVDNLVLKYNHHEALVCP